MIPVKKWAQICVIVSICSFALDRVYHRTRKKKNKGIPLPPGPPPLPIVGNVTTINKGAPWLTYTEWGVAYGDLVYTRFFNEELILVNSLELTRALFDQHSNLYSDRPPMATYTLYV
ncbi:hypothetical protein ID866_3411 [Astraeus odoratus]|nr:hypothetical protein ID866_3411 [Astraeus odoratus]